MSKVEEIRAIMAAPKHVLRKLRILFLSPLFLVGGNDEYLNTIAKATMDIMAEGTNQNVESVLWQSNVPVSPGAFDKFIEKNKSSIHSFSLRDTLSPQDEGDIIAKLLRKCTALEEVSFQGDPHQVVLRTLQRRGVYFRRP